MQYIRVLSMVCFLSALLAASAAAQTPVDSSAPRNQLAEAGVQYDKLLVAHHQSIAEARQKLLQSFDTEIRVVRDKKALKNAVRNERIDALEADKQRCEASGVCMPKEPELRDAAKSYLDRYLKLRKGFRTNAEKLATSFERAGARDASAQIHRSLRQDCAPVVDPVQFVKNVAGHVKALNLAKQGPPDTIRKRLENLLDEARASRIAPEDMKGIVESVLTDVKDAPGYRNPGKPFTKPLHELADALERTLRSQF